MERLKRWLDETETTQTALAEALKVSQPTVCDWVNGNTKPSLENLRTLSQHTALSFDELLDAPKHKARRTNTRAVA